MDFVVRRCGPGDETALSLIGQATMLETYAGVSDAADLYAYVGEEMTVEAFRPLLESDRARIWIVEADVGKSVVGYALVRSEELGEPFATSQLKRLYLLYRFHGHGLGRRLMDEALADARASGTSLMTLQVHEKNENAIAFYERYGFKITGSEPFRAGARDYQVFAMQLMLQEG